LNTRKAYVFIKIILGPQEGLFHQMIDSFLTVGVWVKSGWTQLKLEFGEEGGAYACNPGGGGRQARVGGRGGPKKMRAYTRAGEDKDYKEKYAHVTLAEEDYKP
jgi:hypothetical protein